MFDDLRKSIIKIRPYLKGAFTPSRMHPYLKLGLSIWAVILPFLFIALISSFSQLPPKRKGGFTAEEYDQWIKELKEDKKTCKKFLAGDITEKEALDILMPTGRFYYLGKDSFIAQCRHSTLRQIADD